MRWLTQPLHDHFPTLPVTAWSAAFHLFQPALWEDRDGTSLDYEDVTQFAQSPADPSLVPDLNPPLYCSKAFYLADVYDYLSQVAIGLRPKLGASYLARILELMALIDRLAIGNAVAERVRRRSRGGKAAMKGGRVVID